MSSWTVDAGRHPGVLTVVVVGSPDVVEMRKLVSAHNAAIDAFAGASYRVFCDLREMKVLSPEAAEVFEQAKTYSSSQPNFRGSGVLVASQVVGMQHRRTSIAGGVMETELISTDEAALWEHLAALAV
ncbi:hypothetical protein acdb102_06500 [Acidothermaceae bacterium B102]|nr:hypothetical protein acdb102_06500 [Acidothermaceae bacterium B102]